MAPSASIPDPRREAVGRFEWNPSRQLLASLRRYERVAARRSWLAKLLKPWITFQYRFWSVVTGADIPLGCQIGVGLLLPHPNGIVVHPDAIIGPNCLLFQQVTLAATEAGAPRLGGHVDIGAGAKILGPVRIGDHAKVGANAVVLHDVPEGVTVVGIPARVIRRDSGAPPEHARREAPSKLV